MNDRAIRRVFHQLRTRHPELVTRPNWDAFRRILARENVGLIAAPER